MAIHIFQPSEQLHIQKTDRIQENCWVRVFEPTNEEIQKLSQNQEIPIDLLTDPLDQNEGARTEKDGIHSLVILHSPIQEDLDDGFTFKTIPMGVLLVQNIVYTICAQPITPLTQFVKHGAREIDLNNKKSILLYLLHNSAKSFLFFLKSIERKHLYLEKKLSKKIIDQDIIDLHNLKKSLVFFTSAIKGNISVIQKLERNLFIKFTEDELDSLSDILTELNQAISLTETLTDTVLNTLHTFTLVISSEFSNIWKVLTVVTLFLMLPTLVASTYGMNIAYIPFAKHLHNVTMILLLTIVIIIGTVIYLKKKKWL